MQAFPGFALVFQSFFETRGRRKAACDAFSSVSLRLCGLSLRQVREVNVFQPVS